MKLLICTQVVDAHDSNLGFFTGWLAEFAKSCESVEVICLREGTHTLPANVQVHLLRKGGRLVRAVQLKWLAWRLRNRYDAVFVHMNPEYIVVAGPLWRLLGKRIGLWYAHKSVTLKLRLATLFATDIFTVQEESFRIKTKKKHVMGHGIDTARFSGETRTRSSNTLRLLAVGRISAVKHLLELFPALDELAQRGQAFSLKIVGAPLTQEDQKYAVRLEAEKKSRPYAQHVELMLGGVPHKEVSVLLAGDYVTLNLATTGNMDKTGLEALAAGVPLVTTNEAYRVLGKHSGLELTTQDPVALADAMLRAWGADTTEISGIVQRDHSLEALIPRIVDLLSRL